MPYIYGEKPVFEPDEKHKTGVDLWLKAIGLSFDPFSALEASSDAHLSSYFIGHKAFEIAWGDWNSIVFAPAGGGKTALRAQVIQAFWVGQETNRPFPISYIPPFIRWGHTTPSAEEHLLAISQSGAEYLLLALAHRPHWYLRLSAAEKMDVANALAWNLPGPLASYLRPCRASGSLEPLQEKFSPVALPPDPPEAQILVEFLNALNVTGAPSTRSTVSKRWTLLLDVLLNTLKFPSIYILLDGLDATQEMVGTPSLSVEFFSSLVPFLPAWVSRRVFLKSFIPIETRSPLQEASLDFVRRSQITTIEWTPALLAEMIRRRVYSASEGEYGSLGPFSSPEVRDPEIELARAIIPLPREMLVLTSRVLVDVIERADQNPKITSADVESAIAWYRQTSPAEVLISK